MVMGKSDGRAVVVPGGGERAALSSDFLREGRMGDRKPAARWRRQGRGRADTCGANPSLGGGNPHPPSLAWSSWEVSVEMGSGWECWQQVLCHSLPLKATGARVGHSHRSCLLTAASPNCKACNAFLSLGSRGFC